MVDAPILGRGWKGWSIGRGQERRKLILHVFFFFLWPCTVANEGRTSGGGRATAAVAHATQQAAAQAAALVRIVFDQIGRVLDAELHVHAKIASVAVRACELLKVQAD